MAKLPLGDSFIDGESGRHSPRNGEEPKGPRRAGSSAQKSRIADVAIHLFQDNPGSFWSALPELASAIETHLQSGGPRLRRTSVFDGYMTEREREFKLHSLSDLTERYKAAGTLEPDEARQALTLSAALREHAVPHKPVLMQIVEHVLQLSLDSQKPEKLVFRKGKPEHHTFSLIRGLTLSLAWDGELIGIAFDPKEYAFRQKALSFVGIASDTQPDVAERHDAYLWTTPDGR
jgi:hypothetical protein